MNIKLTKRDKYLVALAACSLLAFLLMQFLVLPFFDSRARLQRGLKAKEAGLKEIVMLREEYRAVRQDSHGIEQRLAGRQKDFTLFSFLEKAAGKTEIKKHIKYMKPSVTKETGPFKSSQVEMKLENITLAQLVSYLGQIESPDEVVTIKRLSIQENKRAPGYLDAILQVLTFQL